MFIPSPKHTTTPEDTAKVMLNEHEYCSFCDSFQYLGTMFDTDLNDSFNVKKRIKKGCGAFVKIQKVLRSLSITTKLRLQTYEATVLNILLYGCESWALKESDPKK